MFKFIDVNQNTDEWFQMRCGKLTSSKLGTIMANYGKAFGEPAKKYAVNIAIEQITGNPIASTFSNDHMQRGHDRGDEGQTARSLGCNPKKVTTVYRLAKSHVSFWIHRRATSLQNFSSTLSSTLSNIENAPW